MKGNLGKIFLTPLSFFPGDAGPAVPPSALCSSLLRAQRILGSDPSGPVPSGLQGQSPHLRARGAHGLPDTVCVRHMSRRKRRNSSLIMGGELLGPEDGHGVSGGGSSLRAWTEGG